MGSGVFPPLRKKVGFDPHGTVYHGVGYNMWPTQKGCKILSSFKETKHLSLLRVFLDDKHERKGTYTPYRVTLQTTREELQEAWSKAFSIKALAGESGLAMKLNSQTKILITFNPPPLRLLCDNVLKSDECIKKVAEWVVAGVNELSRHQGYVRIKFIEIFNEPSADPSWGFSIPANCFKTLLEHILLEVKNYPNLVFPQIVAPGIHIVNKDLFREYYNLIKDINNLNNHIIPSIHVYEKNKTIESHNQMCEELKSIIETLVRNDNLYVTELATHSVKPKSASRVEEGNGEQSLYPFFIADNAISCATCGAGPIIFWHLIDEEWMTTRDGFYSTEGLPKPMNALVDFFLDIQPGSHTYSPMQKLPDNTRIALFVNKPKHDDDRKHTIVHVIISNSSLDPQYFSITLNKDIISSQDSKYSLIQNSSVLTYPSTKYAKLMFKKNPSEKDMASGVHFHVDLPPLIVASINLNIT